MHISLISLRVPHPEEVSAWYRTHLGLAIMVTYTVEPVTVPHRCFVVELSLLCGERFVQRQQPLRNGSQRYNVTPSEHSTYNTEEIL